MWGGCGKVYGVSGEVCWRVGKGCGEGNEEDVGKCVEVWGPNTLLIPHISSLPSPLPTSPLTSPTPRHTFLHLLSYLFPHSSFLSPHPNTFSYYPHISLHLLKVWQSYHVTKFLWRSYCGEVTMWRSYWQPLRLLSNSICALKSSPEHFYANTLSERMWLQQLHWVRRKRRNCEIALRLSSL